MIMNEIPDVNLPKWSQMIVTGKELPEETALEIIRRTDSFFSWPYCNDRDFERRLLDTFKVPYTQNDRRFNKVDYIDLKKFHTAWGYVDLNHFNVDWVCSCSGNGPSGWVHPDGSIGYFYNIGKYPSLDAVVHDLTTLVEIWPELELEVTLMDDEWCEYGATPVISILIRESDLEFVNPKVRNIHEEAGRYVPEMSELEPSRGSMYSLLNSGYVSKISFCTMKRWVDSTLNTNER